MQIDLTGKTAIVTGSTRGIGLAAAKGLAASGARVVINGRSRASVDGSIKMVKAAAPNAHVIGAVADLSSADGCASLVKAVPQCDILVNNMGIYSLVPKLRLRWFPSSSLGTRLLELPPIVAGHDWKLELPKSCSQAGAWEPAESWSLGTS